MLLLRHPWAQGTGWRTRQIMRCAPLGNKVLPNLASCWHLDVRLLLHLMLADITGRHAQEKSLPAQIVRQAAPWQLSALARSRPLGQARPETPAALARPAANEAALCRWAHLRTTAPRSRPAARCCPGQRPWHWQQFQRHLAAAATWKAIAARYVGDVLDALESVRKAAGDGPAACSSDYYFRREGRVAC